MTEPGPKTDAMTYTTLAKPDKRNELHKTQLPKLRVVLAAPRGFCAGVERAIQMVERALDKYGSPVYVRHEIVHNKTVVADLTSKGAIFVDELDDVPEDAPVIFSAHGVPKSVTEEANRRNLFYLDATCPLVSKVHNEAERHFNAGRQILLIGHANHPEVIGTIGQLPTGSISLVESADDVEKVQVPPQTELAYITQTTLSVDETAEIIAQLRVRFPEIVGPHKNDICYATTNRQEAVKEIARMCDVVIVLGSLNSSNSKRLVDVAIRGGCQNAFLIDSASQMDWQALGTPQTLGITAGASAPESLVSGLLAELKFRFDVDVEEWETVTEDVSFKLPRVLVS